MVLRVSSQPILTGHTTIAASPSIPRTAAFKRNPAVVALARPNRKERQSQAQDQQPDSAGGVDEYAGYNLDESDSMLLPADGGYQGYDYEYEDEPSESNSNYYSQPSTYTQQPSAPDWNEMRELELDRLSNLEDLMGSSGLGRVDAVQQLRQRQAQAIRDSLKKDVREGGSVSKLTDEMAADGYDLQADWEAMEVKNTTTGAGRKGGSRAAVADQLLQPPSSPKINRLRNQEAAIRRTRRLFGSPSDAPYNSGSDSDSDDRLKQTKSRLLQPTAQPLWPSALPSSSITSTRPNGSRVSGKYAEGSLEAELEAAESEPGGRYQNLEDGFLKGMRAAMAKPELSGRPMAPGAAAAAKLREVLMKAKQTRADAAAAAPALAAPAARPSRPAPAGLGRNELADMMDALSDGTQDFDDFYTGSSGNEFDSFYTTTSSSTPAAPPKQLQPQGQARFPSTPAWVRPLQSDLSGLDSVFGGEAAAPLERMGSSQQWATPELVSKPGVGKPVVKKVVVVAAPAAPAKPAASAPSQQALREDAFALQDMLAGLDEDYETISQPELQAGSTKSARATPQWATPALVSKPGVGVPKKAVVDLVPPPPSKPLASAPSRQAMAEDASALEDMLADFDDEILGMSQEQVRAAAAAKSAAPLRVTPQWVTPPLVSKPGVGMPKKKALQVVDLIPPPPSKPVPSVLSRQAQRQDASDLNDMLADFDEDVYDGAERAAASGAPKTGPVRVKQQWSTPQLASAPAKPGLKPAVSNTLKAEPVSPAPPARPVASAPSRQAMQEDASALEDMLEGFGSLSTSESSSTKTDSKKAPKDSSDSFIQGTKQIRNTLSKLPLQQKPNAPAKQQPVEQQQQETSYPIAEPITALATPAVAAAAPVAAAPAAAASSRAQAAAAAAAAVDAAMAAAEAANLNLAAAQAQLLASQAEFDTPPAAPAVVKNVDWDLATVSSMPARQQSETKKAVTASKGPLIVQLPGSIPLSSKPAGRTPPQAAVAAAAATARPTSTPTSHPVSSPPATETPSVSSDSSPPPTLTQQEPQAPPPSESSAVSAEAAAAASESSEQPPVSDPAAAALRLQSSLASVSAASAALQQLQGLPRPSSSSGALLSGRPTRSSMAAPQTAVTTPPPITRGERTARPTSATLSPTSAPRDGASRSRQQEDPRSSRQRTSPFPAQRTSTDDVVTNSTRPMPPATATSSPAPARQQRKRPTAADIRAAVAGALQTPIPASQLAVQLPIWSDKQEGSYQQSVPTSTSPSPTVMATPPSDTSAVATDTSADASSPAGKPGDAWISWITADPTVAPWSRSVDPEELQAGSQDDGANAAAPVSVLASIAPRVPAPAPLDRPAASLSSAVPSIRLPPKKPATVLPPAAAAALAAAMQSMSRAVVAGGGTATSKPSFPSRPRPQSAAPHQGSRNNTSSGRDAASPSAAETSIAQAASAVSSTDMPPTGAAPAATSSAGERVRKVIPPTPGQAAAGTAIDVLQQLISTGTIDAPTQ